VLLHYHSFKVLFKCLAKNLKTAQPGEISNSALAKTTTVKVSTSPYHLSPPCYGGNSKPITHL